MINCVACGRELKDSARFCKYCGAEVAQTPEPESQEPLGMFGDTPHSNGTSAFPQNEMPVDFQPQEEVTAEEPPKEVQHPWSIPQTPDIVEQFEPETKGSDNGETGSSLSKNVLLLIVGAVAAFLVLTVVFAFVFSSFSGGKKDTIKSDQETFTTVTPSQNSENMQFDVETNQTDASTAKHDANIPEMQEDTDLYQYLREGNNLSDLIPDFNVEEQEYQTYYYTDAVDWYFGKSTGFRIILIKADCPYSIAGVKWGMTPSIADKNLSMNGFRKTASRSNNQTYEDDKGAVVDLWFTETENPTVDFFQVYLQAENTSVDSISFSGELTQLLELDIFLMAEYLFNCNSLIREDNRLTFENDWFRMGAPVNDAKIDQLTIIENDQYSIGGVYCGMTMSQVKDRMRNSEYSLSWNETNALCYSHPNGYSVVYVSDGGASDRVVYMGAVIGTVSFELTSPDQSYLLPESNSRYLQNEDLAPLTHEELCFARNEIFARHGWIFSVTEIAEFFSDKEWYVGTTLPQYFSTSVFNEYENYNIQFITAYENQYYGGSYY